MHEIKNRIRPSVALAADFRSWDIDVGDISETHHHMLIIGLYHPPSYDEGDLTDFVIDLCDTFLDIHPNGVVL